MSSRATSLLYMGEVKPITKRDGGLHYCNIIVLASRLQTQGTTRSLRFSARHALLDSLPVWTARFVHHTVTGSHASIITITHRLHETNSSVILAVLLQLTFCAIKSVHKAVGNRFRQYFQQTIHVIELPDT